MEAAEQRGVKAGSYFNSEFCVYEFCIYSFAGQLPIAVTDKSDTSKINNFEKERGWHDGLSGKGACC